MRSPRFSLSKRFFFGWSAIAARDCTSALAGRALLASADRPLHHLFIHRDHSLSLGGIELEIANHAAIRVAQRARTEAFLSRGIPRDRDECAARDLKIDTEALEVFARRAE